MWQQFYGLYFCIYGTGMIDSKMAHNKRGAAEDLIVGRNAVKEALKALGDIDKILISRGEKSGSLAEIIAEAKKRGIVVKEASVTKLDFLSANANHQGVIAFAPAHSYSTVEDILNLALSRDEDPFVIIADRLEDPHNLGAIIRTAECAGAHGVIIPRHRSASLSFAVGKASAGALEYLPVAKVTNISNTIEDLKSKGLWVYGADMQGEDYRSSSLTGPIALVLGNEGSGLSRLVRQKCDGFLSIPLKGKISSLNVSVSAAILMYEVLKHR